MSATIRRPVWRSVRKSHLHLPLFFSHSENNKNTFNWAVELSQQRASRETMFSECEGALGWGGWQPYWPRDFSQAQHGSCNPMFTEHRPRQALLEQMRAFAPHTNCTGSRLDSYCAPKTHLPAGNCDPTCSGLQPEASHPRPQRCAFLLAKLSL